MNADAAARIRPMPLPLKLDLLTEGQVERLHRATLDVLGRAGMQIRSPSLVRALGHAGARVEEDEGCVRFPPEMVEEAVARAPCSYLMAARDPACDVTLDGSHGYLTLDGCASDVVDLDTGRQRPSTKADLENATRLADAVPEVTIAWQPVAARDVPTSVQSLHEVHAQLTNTSKHIQQMTVIDPGAARAAVAMARIVAGGDRALRERPIMSAFQCSLSPLTFDGGPLEAAVVYAEAGIPCGFVAMPLTCATAPATVAGTMVMTNAELLGGITALEFLVPGAATFYGVCTSTMDLTTGSLAYAWGPEEQLFSFASAQLARRYQIPSQLGTFGTGAKTQDWQAGAQHAISGLSSVLSGGDMYCATGTIYGGRVFAFEQVLLDAELFDLIRHMTEGFSVSEEDLATSVIEAVGPGGHFLSQPHTLANMRRLWQSRFFNRDSWEDWEAAGRPEPRDRARERARTILAEHTPMPLPDGVEEELLRIIQSHERETEGAHHG